MKKVDGNTTGTWDGFLYIISENKCKTICITAHGTEDDQFITLNDCLSEIGYEEGDTVIVIIENLLKGKVYRYNNYMDNSWYEYGTTEGYA